MSNQTSRLIKSIATLTIPNTEQASNIVLAESFAHLEDLAIFGPVTLAETVRVELSEVDSAAFVSMQRAACSNFLGTPFTDGEDLSFSNSGAVGILSATDNANYIRYILVSGSPNTNDTISGDTSGASADVDTLGAAVYEDEDFNVSESPAGTPVIVSANGQTTLGRFSAFALRLYAQSAVAADRVFKLVGCAPLHY